VLAGGAVACASFGGARPRHAPLPDAVVIESSEPVTAILAGLRDSLTARGFAVRVDAPREGYLETGWYDVPAGRATREPFRHLADVVRVRLYVDRIGTRTRVIAEVVRRMAWDPSRPERELEVMVADSAPGRVLLDDVLRGVPRPEQRTPAVPGREEPEL
jgi:hypothetical protein